MRYCLKIPSFQVLETINEDSFTSQEFKSSSNKIVSDKVYINLKDDTFSVPLAEEKPEEFNFHPSFIGDEKVNQEKWIKKLFNYRRKEAFL